MLNYFKGSASAIIIALLVLFIIGQFDYKNYFFSIFLVISIFGYLFGILGMFLLILIKKKGYSSIKSYSIFLFLGIGLGGIVELVAEGYLFPTLIITTIASSLSFLASQTINSKFIAYPLSLLPVIIIGLIFFSPYIN